MKCSFGMRLRVGRFVERKQPPFNSDITRRKWVELNKLFEIRPFRLTVAHHPWASRDSMEGVADGGRRDVVLGGFRVAPFLVRDVRQSELHDVIEAEKALTVFGKLRGATSGLCPLAVRDG